MHLHICKYISVGQMHLLMDLEKAYWAYYSNDDDKWVSFIS